MSVTERFLEWVQRVVVQHQPITADMSLCPFAAKALADNKVHIEEFAYTTDQLQPILDRVLWLSQNPLVDVMILLHPDRPCRASEHRHLEEILAPLALRLGQHVFGYHVDDPTRIGHRVFNMPVCGLQFQPYSMVQEARSGLLKTRYYDGFTVAQLKDLRFFQE